ncbi:Rieske 2Fe-2S domain-containing protein [Serratia entomophila]|uniref:Rieske 2Fe-2S domain-containing protein n=1 Tax=Serratia entomophila TaxID=42906 RepID=UPI0021779BC2|nr:Rieske 2Fe-2S domain-containing protein [Serratia entomophila]CAI0849119.1 3-ketosteroid-9-alpha-hydroxylase oxygenase subunit [Serratia entomophila]CAI1530322.1 3-ketosteroid-9-alpha-hydroxylase oxygenase subunit [Serratia entomophila]CAI1567203.1 3-ketosteroid-9-alpha-hydroxylase oxygenase subunit [Serratia entomophila]CAI1697388.1 3-ketosteroid-9-alpha-hydroxylase oxygenase subunit [Serratia entomophila]CAI1717533.1 3-ketosteroid-9-alpha-hydroxylase oxygenase subunit [Serratia entomophil
MQQREYLPYPTGWFAACFSHDLKPGAVLTVPFMGQELVLYRTRSGLVRVIEPYCPHFGAHLGDGRVDGEQLICSLHSLAFGSDGQCTSASRGGSLPKAALTFRYMQETRGMILVWHDAQEQGREPGWHLPALDLSGFSPPLSCCYHLSGYAQDMAENSADPHHFAAVHGFTDVEMKHDIDGHMMEIRMSARWRNLPLRMRLRNYGIGHVLGESELPGIGVQVKTLAFSTQIAPLSWIFRWMDVLHVNRFDRLPGLLSKWLHSLLITLAHRWFVRVVRDDFPIWNHRNYIKNPRFMTGEGTIAAFRHWSYQFYPSMEDARKTSVAHAALLPAVHL